MVFFNRSRNVTRNQISIPPGKVPAEGDARIGKETVRGISVREAEPRDDEELSNEMTETISAFIKSLSAPELC